MQTSTQRERARGDADEEIEDEEFRKTLTFAEVCVWGVLMSCMAVVV